MAIRNSSTNVSPNMRKSERYCIIALVLLCLAMFFLSVVVFTVSPLTILGVVSTCIGVLLMIGCIVSFALYSYYLKKESDSIPG